MRVLGPSFTILFVLAGLSCQRDLHTCDITQRSCQELVYYTTLALRGDGYDPFGGLPPIRVITEDEFRNELITAAATPPSEAQLAWDVALSLLHLYPPKSQTPDGGMTEGTPDSLQSVDPKIEDEATHVYAYFNSIEHTITLVSHPGETGAAAQTAAMMSLAHEFVHALQDREINLRGTFATFDEYLAQKTIVEGDARFYERLFENNLYSQGKNSAQIVRSTHDELRYYFNHFDLLGSPFYAAEMFIYPLGSQYLATIWASGGNAAVRRALRSAPTSTLGFLISPDGIPPHGMFRPMTCKAPSAADMVTVGQDRMGALVFFTFLRGWNVPQDLAFLSAQGWRNDQMLVFENQATRQMGVSWRVELERSPPPALLELLTSTGELFVVTQNHALEITTQTTEEEVAWRTDPACP